MSLHTDKRYLREEQYSDTSNLSTCINKDGGLFLARKGS